MSSHTSLLFGLFFDSPHVAYNQATGPVGNYVVGGLVAYLVVEIPELRLGAGLRLLLGCHQSAMLAGAVLCVGELLLDGPH
ncbi:MAG: hypothetical protein ACYDGY_05310 [Acidimicrobiales bacterium]